MAAETPSERPPTGLFVRLGRWTHEPAPELQALEIPAQQARLRWIIGVELLLLAFFAMLHASRHQTLAAVTQVVVGSLLLAVYLRVHRLREDQPAGLLVHLNIGLLVADVVVVSMLTGQHRAIAPWYLAAMPLCVYTEGLVAAVSWVAVSALGMGAIELSRYLATVEPELIPGPQHNFPVRITLLLLMAAFGLSARRAHNIQLARAAERERVIRAQAESLALARDAALDAARAKAQFLANMSHEIRTPLAGVIGIADLLEHTPLDARQGELVGLLTQSGRSLLGIINEVLDFSKVEAGQLALSPAPFDPRATAEAVAALAGVHGEQPAAPVTLAVEVDATVPPLVVADENRVRQVLVNLVGNAVRFTPRGAITIGIGPLAAGRLHFLVRDTGVGIAPADQARLFEPFMQADDSHARRHGGTGLGLAICRRLVEAMGGTIAAESEPGVGSTFRFDIRAEPHSAADRAAPPAAAGAPDPVIEPGGEMAASHPCSILVAEDNAINRRLIGSILGRLGYEPTLTGDGEAAVQACRERRYDLVLMDLQMPGTDGITATRRLRAEAARVGHPRVIALTASVLPAQQRQCEEAGMDGFIRKPFSARDIVEAVRTASGQPPADALAPPIVAGAAGSFDERRLTALQAIVTDEHDWRRLLDEHLDASARLVARIRAAHAGGDCDELERAAHSLASSSAMFGAEAVSAACRRIEEQAQARTLGGIAEEVALLADEYGAARRHLLGHKHGARASG